MTPRQAFFAVLVFLLLLPQAATANLRAPVNITSASGTLTGVSEKRVRVLGETLDFRCPSAHVGKPDYRVFETSNCHGTITYDIEAEETTATFQFVYSGGSSVIWQLGDARHRSAARKMTSTETKSCTYCPREMQNLFVSEQQLRLLPGHNQLTVEYDQSLFYSEHGHGYFSGGKWQQGFAYELWPIAEWNWGNNMTAKLRLQIAARPGFLGIGYKDDLISCKLSEFQSNHPIDLQLEPVKDGVRTARAQMPMRKAPQRLVCSYSAD
jgi:hypothetical protein